MRIEDVKMKLKESIVPIIQEFYNETGLSVTSIDIDRMDITNIDSTYHVYRFGTPGIRLTLDYER